MEFLFQGDWVIVTRKVGDTTSRGLVIGYYKRRYQAEQDVAEWRERKPDWQVWTMRRADY